MAERAVADRRRAWALAGAGVLLAVGWQRRRAAALLWRLTEEMKKLIQKARDLPATAPTFTGASYASLPMGPPEVGPLGSDRQVSSLQPAFPGPGQLLQQRLNAALGPSGLTATIVDTRRSELRQLALWAVGRVWRWPGRSGPVTRAKEPKDAAHLHGWAVDLWFRTADGKTAADEAVDRALASHVSRLEAETGTSWGGRWKDRDRPHWEAQDWKASVSRRA